MNPMQSPNAGVGRELCPENTKNEIQQLESDVRSLEVLIDARVGTREMRQVWKTELTEKQHRLSILLGNVI